MKKLFTLVAAVFVAASAFAQTEISELIQGKTDLSLEAGKEYTLNAVATLATDVVTINGNGATIKVGEAGKFSIQKGIVLNDVNLDASATSNAVLEFSKTPDASLATYEGEVMKYANASWKGYEAEKIELNGCTFITNNSVIRPAAAWALRTLTIDNSIIEVKYKSGKAIINMEENGAGVIQNINIKNSTIYADDPATDMRFHRYAAQNDPWRVWGYEGEDKNVTKDYWTLENNTFVNVCGNKEFSNNMKNTNATEFTFKGNIFANTWRINKLGGNCKRNFVKEDNVICGGTNPVDGTDANWFTVDEEVGIYVNAEGKNFVPDAYSIAAEKKYGDPRYLSSIGPKNDIARLVKNAETVELDPAVSYVLDAPANLVADKVVTIKGNGATITYGAEGQLIAKAGVILNNVKIDATASGKAPIALANKEALTAADTTAFASWKVVEVPTTYTKEEADAYNEENGLEEGDEGSVKEGDPKPGVSGTKDEFIFPNASNKVFIAELISIVNSEIKTASSFVSGGNAPWALRTLNVDNSIVCTTTGSGKAFIDWESGATQIKDIAIKNSTLFSTVEASAQRFHRYTAQVDPWRVWGYEDGTDKNAPGQNTWVLTNNTIVNLCGNKEFSNNMKNTPATTFEFKGNIFANTWRINKLGTNCKRLFAKEDNVICGGVNAVDGTDANWFTAVENLGIKYSAVPATTDFAALAACMKPVAEYVAFGDPRWQNAYTFDLKAEISSLGKPTQVIEHQIVTIALNSTKDEVTVYLPEAELKGWTMKATALTIPCTTDETKVSLNGVPAESVVFVNPAKENVTAAVSYTTGFFEFASGQGNAQIDMNVPGIGDVKVVYNGEVTTGIKNVEAAAVKSANAKFIENGRVVIVKNGAKFNVAGQVIK